MRFVSIRLTCISVYVILTYFWTPGFIAPVDGAIRGAISIEARKMAV